MSQSSSIKVIEGARSRRASRSGKEAIRLEWFGKEVNRTVNLTMKKRVKIATKLIEFKVIKNISKPVTKSIVNNSIVVSGRSKPGEFPKADTTQLMKTIFSGFANQRPGVYDGFVGTPLEYGAFHEFKSGRSFLKRTLNEEISKVTLILGHPMKSISGSSGK